jgi:hypothetical protein
MVVKLDASKRKAAIAVVLVSAAIVLKITTDRPAKENFDPRLRPAVRTEAQLPRQFWTAFTAQAFDRFSGERNLGLRNPDDDMFESIDETGQVFRVTPTTRSKLDTHTIEKVDLTNDKIPEWIVRIKQSGRDYFAIMQTVDQGMDFTVVMGQGDVVIDEPVVTMFGADFYARTNDAGLLWFKPVEPEVRCETFEEC